MQHVIADADLRFQNANIQKDISCSGKRIYTRIGSLEAIESAVTHKYIPSETKSGLIRPIRSALRTFGREFHDHGYRKPAGATVVHTDNCACPHAQQEQRLAFKDFRLEAPNIKQQAQLPVVCSKKGKLDSLDKNTIDSRQAQKPTNKKWD